MTDSDFEKFEIFKNTLFNQLKANSKECFKTISKESQLINRYLNSGELSNVKKFVNEFNNVILDSTFKKFKLFESVLERGLFNNVLNEFRESDILIKACKTVNKKAVEWLFTMKINYAVQDEEGMTALMYAVKHVSLEFAVEKILKSKGEHIYLVDNEGNNVLFHATQSPEILKKLLKSKFKFDIKQLNNNNESLLLYCSRYDRMKSFEILNKYRSFDPYLTNKDGKTTAMYLVKNGRFAEIKSFVKGRNIDPNFKNKSGESLVSIFIKSYYKHYIGDDKETDFSSICNTIITKNYANTLRSLIDLKCNFNVSIDEKGNTPIMALCMMGDDNTSQYLIDKGIVDLSIENSYEENALNYSYNFYPMVEKNIPIAQN